MANIVAPAAADKRPTLTLKANGKEAPSPAKIAGRRRRLSKRRKKKVDNALAYLAGLGFPVFVRMHKSKQMTPLVDGIGNDICNRVPVEEHAKVHNALHWLCYSKRYLRSLDRPEAAHHDLDGHIVSLVSDITKWSVRQRLYNPAARAMLAGDLGLVEADHA